MVLIAANMVAEVCSVYVLRVDSTLELYATEGLNKSAVHQTVLRSDEGLVGLVAGEAKIAKAARETGGGVEGRAHVLYGLMDELGEDHLWHSISQGVRAARAAHGMKPAKPDTATLPGSGSTELTSTEDGGVEPELVIPHSSDRLPEETEAPDARGGVRNRKRGGAPR